MTFIQPLLLAGLGLISIPILIHLFNRRKATVVEWGAMRFLTGSVVSRRRRIQIEEIVLLALRCLLVALIVLAVARPFVPVGASLAWLLALPALLLAAIALAVGTIMLQSRLHRALLFGGVAAVLALVVWASQMERVRHMKIWGGKSGQDVAIVIDASASMALAVDGHSNFDRALAEAQAVVEDLEIGDGAVVLLAGASPHPVTPSPVSANSELIQRIAELKPAGGSMSLLDSLDAAAELLTRGDNAAKKIVVLTDGQNVGWDADNASRWEHLQNTLGELTVEPKVILRNLKMPTQFRNLSVASIDVSRTVIGVDRPVAIRVQVENTGSETLTAEGVRLQIGDDVALTETLAAIAPGASEVIEFQHQFTSGGPQHLRARVLVNDDLSSDDVRHHVVTTFASLPVLLVDGNGEARRQRQATSFLELALAPPHDQTDERLASGAAAPFITTQVLSITDFDQRVNLSDYRVIVLANVSRLPATACARLNEFVERGGGLLVVGGRNCEADFYNQWRDKRGADLLPGKLVERIALAHDVPPVKPSRNTFTHASLTRFREGALDLDGAAFTGYWRVAPSGAGASGGNLSTGDPLLLERRRGRGRVALTAVSLDHTDGDLPGQMSFLPFVHELVQHLASPILPELNADLAAAVKLQFPLAHDEAPDSAALVGGQGAAAIAAAAGSPQEIAVNVLSPNGTEQAATALMDDGTLSLSLFNPVEAGLYHVRLPKSLVSQVIGLQSIPPSPGGSTTAASNSFPLALTTPSAESRLQPVGPAEEAVAARYLDYFAATNRDNMLAALRGDVPGQELWKLMALAALLTLLAENLVTRTIGRNRKLGQTQPVDFTNEGQRMTSRRAEAKSLVAAARERRAARRRADSEAVGVRS